MTEPAWSRFVIHLHTGHGPQHWDLMLVDGDALATWKLERFPLQDDREPIRATRIADHRMAYLTYEGPTSSNRGEVKRADAGVYRTIERAEDAWRFELRGERLSGLFLLRRSGRAEGSEADWVLRCPGVF